MPSNILFLSPVSFAGLDQRHQNVARLLARAGHTVWFVEPPAVSFSRQRREVEARLWVLDAPVPWRATGWPALHAIALRWAWRALVRDAGVLVRETMLWVADPAWASLAGLPWRGIVYDCCDRHGWFPGQRLAPWERYEAALIARAGLILASHPTLATSLRRRGARQVLSVPNAARCTWAIEPHVPIAPGPPWRLLSTGAHHEWIDVPWLEAWASRPDTEIHLAGIGRGPGFERLIRRPRVRHHGPVEAPMLLRLTDVCHIGLLPFRNIPLSAGVDPIKAYDFAIRGLPVWASGQPGGSSASADSAASTRVRIIPRDAIASFPLSAAWETDRAGMAGTPVPTWEDRLQPVLDFLTLTDSR